MFAYIISKLSKESLDELQGDKQWAVIEASRDPLSLLTGSKGYSPNPDYIKGSCHHQENSARGVRRLQTRSI
jgi:hypothetical protein